MTFPPSSEEARTPNKKKPRLALLIATFFYSGYFPKAPGTIASILTALLWLWPISYYGVSPFVRLASAAIIFVIGLWASEQAARYFGGKDPQKIVIDEVAGQTLALTLCAHPYTILFGLVLFRVFDVWKPGPIGWLDKNVKGGMGIMVDDMAAGFVVLLLTLLDRWLWPMMYY